MLIGMAVHLDALLGTNSLTREAVIIAFFLSEVISILGKKGNIGSKVPAPLINAAGRLSKK